jgi:hypothetical protein
MHETFVVDESRTWRSFSSASVSSQDRGDYTEYYKAAAGGGGEAGNHHHCLKWNCVLCYRYDALKDRKSVILGASLKDQPLQEDDE